MPRPRPQAQSQWHRGPPPRQGNSQPGPDIHFYGIYLIVGLSVSMFLFFCLVRTIWRRQRELAIDDLDLEAPSDSLEAYNDGAQDYLWWNDGPGSFQSTTTPSTQALDIPVRPRDDIYEAAVASLISLEAQHDTSWSHNYFLQYRVRDVRKFQRLVEKLRNASYLSENENDPDSMQSMQRRREIEGIRMQIAQLVVDGPRNPGHGRRPRLHIHTEPPPAYHDIVSEESLPPPLSPQHP